MDMPQLLPDQYAIQWPEPAHAKFDEGLVTAEPCEVEFTTGAKAVGDLVHFTGRDDYFMFRPHRSHPHPGQVLTVRMANLRQLRLTRPVGMTPIQDTASGQAGAIFSQTAAQVYNVEFQDGEITSGETAGHVRLPTGLFFFFASGTNQVLRHFVPSGAIAYVQLGDPIGKVLLEENVVSEAQLAVAVEKQQEMRRLVLGDYLIEEGYITADQLEGALEYQKSKPSLRLGEALIEMNYVTSEALQAALARQRANRGRPLGQILIDMGVIDKDTLTRVHAKKLGIPEVNLSKFSISPEALKLIPADAARRLGVLPLAVEDGALIFATADQPASATTSELGLIARMRVVPVLANADEIMAKQTEAYGMHREITDHKSLSFGSTPAFSATGNVDDLASGGILDVTEQLESELESERTLLLLISRIVAGSIRGGTLDIHIESEGTTRRTRISFRHTDAS